VFLEAEKGSEGASLGRKEHDPLRGLVSSPSAGSGHALVPKGSRPPPDDKDVWSTLPWYISYGIDTLYLQKGPMPATQIVKWGNSLSVRIPKPVAEEAGVREGDPMVIEAGAGEINVRKKQRMPTLKELVAQIRPENCYDEIPSGPERGKERLEW
jgi:antitoxin MazE